MRITPEMSCYWNLPYGCVCLESRAGSMRDKSMIHLTAGTYMQGDSHCSRIPRYQ